MSRDFRRICSLSYVIYRHPIAVHPSKDNNPTGLTNGLPLRNNPGALDVGEFDPFVLELVTVSNKRAIATTL